MNKKDLRELAKLLRKARDEGVGDRDDIFSILLDIEQELNPHRNEVRHKKRS